MTEIYAGLDVSDKTTHICAVDIDGKVAWRGVCATDPEGLANTLEACSPGLVRVVVETSTLSSFLYPAITPCHRNRKIERSYEHKKQYGSSGTLSVA